MSHIFAVTQEQCCLCGLRHVPKSRFLICSAEKVMRAWVPEYSPDIPECVRYVDEELVGHVVQPSTTIHKKSPQVIKKEPSKSLQEQQLIQAV